MNNIKTLLSQISDISKKYEEIAKLTGENYNVFRILKLTTAEVKTHSAFIGELLKPNGCHDQGDVFLRLFISKLIEQKKELEFDKNELQIVENFDCPNSIINIEHSYNYTYEDDEERGRVDILVKDNKGKAIIIENKINAGDQKEQLLGYYRYGSYHYKNNSLLFYLTLDGSDPSGWSTGANEQKKDNESKKQLENIRYHTISYKEFILKWLEECRQKAVNHSLLRETITQYINLIKYLTNQTTSVALIF